MNNEEIIEIEATIEELTQEGIELETGKKYVIKIIEDKPFYSE
ncbi:hypothetical protein [Treponema sp.]|nr:hypothetical protein [Treponema sp.]